MAWIRTENFQNIPEMKLVCVAFRSGQKFVGRRKGGQFLISDGTVLDHIPDEQFAGYFLIGEFE